MYVYLCAFRMLAVQVCVSVVTVPRVCLWAHHVASPCARVCVCMCILLEECFDSKKCSNRIIQSIKCKLSNIFSLPQRIFIDFPSTSRPSLPLPFSPERREKVGPPCSPHFICISHRRFLRPMVLGSNLALRIMLFMLALP